jgi:hypothetical protein
MRKQTLAFLLLGAALFHWTSSRGTADDKPEPRPVQVTLDTAEVPELADWAREAKELVEKWHPLIADLLPSDGFTPPGEIKLVFKKDMKGVAFTQGATITIAADWIRKHPDDKGMVVHELTHAIQAYRGAGPGWLVEGIADYIRFYHYEPKTKLMVNPRRASYRDGYRTTAMFLAWIEQAHDKDIVRKLNEALRKREYKDDLFKTCTSKTLDELWDGFIMSIDKK